MPKGLNKVPTYKVIGNLFKFIENPIPIINEYFKDYGEDSFSFNMGGITKAMVTKDPGLVQYVMQKNHKNYRKSYLQSELLAEYIGKGILTTNGAYWLRQRRLIQPGFHKKFMKSFVQIMTSEIDDFVIYLKDKIKISGGEIVMFDEMTRLTLMVISKAIFSSGITEEQIHTLGSGIDHLQDTMVKRVRQPIFEWWRNLKGENKKNKEIADQLYSMIKEIIKERRNSGANNGDILDMLLATRYEDTGEPMSDQQILDECLVLFVAGHETTANALSWTFYLLDQNREHLTAIKEEVEKVSIDSDNLMASLMELDYIRKVISESMRIYPPAWITDRQPIENDNYEGVELDKDYIINIFIYGIHHDPKIWANPKEFDPSRFDKDKMKSIRPYTYFPFGGGPRLCIGHQFAMMEMQLTLYKLVENFNFTCDPDDEVNILPSITLRSTNGIKMNATIRT